MLDTFPPGVPITITGAINFYILPNQDRSCKDIFSVKVKSSFFAYHNASILGWQSKAPTHNETLTSRIGLIWQSVSTQLRKCLLGSGPGAYFENI